MRDDVQRLDGWNPYQESDSKRESEMVYALIYVIRLYFAHVSRTGFLLPRFDSHSRLLAVGQKDKAKEAVGQHGIAGFRPGTLSYVGVSSVPRLQSPPRVRRFPWIRCRGGVERGVFSSGQSSGDWS